jgi:hypothetical protein
VSAIGAFLNLILDEARTALSAPYQDRLADLIAAYVESHAAPPDFTKEELAELKRRHDAPFDPAPEADVEGVLRPPPWLTSASRAGHSPTSPRFTPGS